MASSSGNSSGSTLIQNSRSKGDLQGAMNERKRKRMQSNHESSRRSRMRKQKHLDDLVAQVAQLRNDNAQILNNISHTTQHYLNVERREMEEKSMDTPEERKTKEKKKNCHVIIQVNKQPEGRVGNRLPGEIESI